MTASAVALSLTLTVAAQKPLRADDIPVSAAATAEAREFRRLKVERQVVHRRVKKLLRELHWHPSLDAAVKAAATSGKPIVWIHALGQLTGYV